MCEHPDSTCSKDLDALLAKEIKLSPEEIAAKAMLTHKVVPDVIDCIPESILEVAYACGAKVNNGNVLTPTQVQDPPTTIKWNADEFSYHTLVLLDPDAPSKKEPRHREWHHWLVVNIPGSKLGGGQVLSQYIGSGPPKGTGLHRYVFLVYKQQAKQQFTEPKLTYCSGKGRPNFKIRDFAKKYCLGDPIAGNFFQAKWDSYVPKLYKQLEGK